MLIGPLTLLLAATVSEAGPTAAEIEAAQPEQDSGCVFFTNGLCVCDSWEATVDPLLCVVGDRAGRWHCSYNVVFRDGSSLGNPPYAMQRIDLVQRSADGGWRIVKELRDPISFPVAVPMRGRKPLRTSVR